MFRETASISQRCCFGGVCVFLIAFFTWAAYELVQLNRKIGR